MEESELIRMAKRYAAFDKSDPFTFRRAMTHIQQGIAGRAYHHEATAFHKKGELIDCFYDAEEHSTFDTGGLVHSRFTNMVRP